MTPVDYSTNLNIGFIFIYVAVAASVFFAADPYLFYHRLSYLFGPLYGLDLSCGNLST